MSDEQKWGSAALDVEIFKLGTLPEVPNLITGAFMDSDGAILLEEFARRAGFELTMAHYSMAITCFYLGLQCKNAGEWLERLQGEITGMGKEGEGE